VTCGTITLSRGESDVLDKLRADSFDFVIAISSIVIIVVTQRTVFVRVSIAFTIPHAANFSDLQRYFVAK